MINLVTDVVDVQDIVSIPAGSTVSIVSHRVRPYTVFALTEFCNFVRDDAARGNVTWVVMVNGIPRYPLHSIKMAGQEGVYRSVKSPEMIFHGNDLVEVKATNGGGIDYEAGAAFRGIVGTM